MSLFRNSLHKTYSPRSTQQSEAHTLVLRGEVVCPGMRYRINLSWDGSCLQGRLGGWVWGESLQLRWQDQNINGSITHGTSFRYSGWWHDNRLTLQWQDQSHSNEAWLDFNSSPYRGWFSGSQESIYLDETALGWIAHVGEGSKKRHVHLSANGVPPAVVGLATLIADQAAQNALRLLLQSYSSWA